LLRKPRNWHYGNRSKDGAAALIPRAEALYGFFLDLKKAFDSMDRERCIMILEGCGAGPWMIRLIRGYWRDAIMVCRASGNCGTPFKAGRGVTQAIFDFSCGDLPHKKAGCFPRKEHSTSSQL
jgi:hypothetical protein